MQRVISLVAVSGLAASVSAADIRVSNYGMKGDVRNNNGGTAAVLWDQSNFDGNIAALVDQNFGDFPTYSTFMVDDFSTGGQPWNVNKVSTYFTQGFGFWNAGINQANLQVYSKSGALPSNGDVPPEYTVPVTLVNGGGFWILEADTSGVGELQGINGDYWIGLTPIAAFGQFGQEFHLRIPGNNMDPGAIRNPGGSFGFGTNWANNGVLGFGTEDMAFKLEGDIVPAPGAAALLGLGALAASRRRRA